MDFALIEREVSSWIDMERGTGASEAEIASAEKGLGIQFCGHYREFLLSYGWIRLGTIEVFGLGADVPKHLDLLDITTDERREMNPPLAHFLVPVFNDGSGNLYCVNTASGNSVEPPMVFWDHELGGDQSLEPVGSSFGEWLLDWLKYA